MRCLVLSVPIWLVLSLPALAQAAPSQGAPSPGAPPSGRLAQGSMPAETEAPPVPMPPADSDAGTTAGNGQSESSRAVTSNQQDQGDRRIAPALPAPPVGENADPIAYLRAALSALLAGQAGEAQESLEMAQTRLLDRSVPYARTNAPIESPAIDTISKALRALAANDRAQCMQLIQAAIPQARAAMR